MWRKEQTIEFVNLVGSVGSIIALAVLIVGWFSGPEPHDPTTVLWQCFGFTIALAASATIIVVFVFWVTKGKYPANTVRGVIYIFGKFCLCAFGLVFALDGMVSAIQWTIWPHIPLSFLSVWAKAIIH